MKERLSVLRISMWDITKLITSLRTEAENRKEKVWAPRNGASIFISQEIVSCEIKSFRRGAHCPVDNGFAPIETECRLRSSQIAEMVFQTRFSTGNML